VDDFHREPDLWSTAVMSHEHKPEGFETEVVSVNRIAEEEMLCKNGDEIEKLTIRVV
jgi:hypothetical protein